MNKWFKENKKKIIGGTLVLLSTMVLYKMFNTELPQFKENPDNDIYELTHNADGTLNDYGRSFDTPDNYDDKEFYELTHNADGTLNDYGRSLDD